MFKISLLTLGVAWTTAVQALECHSGGLLVPRPRGVQRLEAVQNALANLTSTLDKAFSGEIQAGFNVQNTSVSMGLVSFDQVDPSVPVWEYHRLSPANIRGTKRIDRHSQYLIGSVTKAISDAILLQHDLNLDDPITKYIPALDEKSSLIRWENITLGALAGQVAGVVPNYGFSEYYYLKDVFEALGFPRLDNASYPECGVIALNGPCSKEELLKGMLLSHPIAPPHSRPVYSNVAFTLLMYAVESVTGKNMTQLFGDFSAALGMFSTRPSPGDEHLAVIPPVDNTWGADFGDNVPGGGLVSTLADLSAFVQAILARSPILGSETRIRAWLQPGAFTGSPDSTVGMPWEIYRPDPSLLFPSGEGHTVTILSKDGGSYGYHARISLLDEYGVGLVILTAGDQSALGAVLSTAASIFIPAVDNAAREQAKTIYSGRFKSTSTPESSSTFNNSSIIVEATAEIDASSLKLTRLSRDGQDILAGLETVWAATAGQFLSAEMLNLTREWRLYPAEITRERNRILNDSNVAVIEEDWRLAWGLQSELPGAGIFAGDCLLWALADWLHYGRESVDRVVFVREAGTGRVLGLEVPFLRSGVMWIVG
ncbi:beta-lactamase/transpeptidase-like protein [Immersiella caudata]|uniref:Beta-lactamase/transpeptidase-like protein n=1 Tax=Immersiella caudata TaxID=314043 RepID=A0AA40BTP5_9PEZI|nr:beta-lactamase/transpeptidase-like protein [Immersiella caudata]